MTRARLILILAAAVLGPLVPNLPRPTRADEAEAALAKYDKPIDEAVDKALAFLAKSQDREGFWPSGMGKSTAVSSLCVMAFLAKGYTPGTGPYGQVINRGLDFVLRCQKPNGLLVEDDNSRAMYHHSISTLMLSEVSGMLDAERQKKVDKALAMALKLILTAQQVKRQVPTHQGGWRYTVQSPDSDISLTGWALMALRSARNNGAQVPKEAIENAVKFVLACRDPRAANAAVPPKDGVGFAYQPGGAPGLARTGTAVLCLELCGKHRSKECLEGGDWILAHPANAFGADFFYYALYYCSQATFQLGGQYWEKFAPRMYDMMLKNQQANGSWPQAAANESAAGVCYSTAMGVLAISVSYRQLPIYQR